ncbi:MAG: hypothetical protein B7Y39_19520, partial [Bdellovibrio sp. 28-41-41]
MRFSILLIVGTIMTSMHAQAQYWGYGLQGGLQGCGYDVSQGEEWNKELGQSKRELSKEQTNLRKYDASLRSNFNAEGYSFVKSHFDGQTRCLDYKGQVAPPKAETKVDVQGAQTGTVGKEACCATPSTPPTETIEKAGSPSKVVGPKSTMMIILEKSRRPAAVEEAEETTVLTIEPEQLNKEWGAFCDKVNNPKGRLSATICKRPYMTGGSKLNLADCQSAVLNYPKSFQQVEKLKKEIEIKKEAIKAAKAQIPEMQKSMREEMMEAR